MLEREFVDIDCEHVPKLWRIMEKTKHDDFDRFCFHHLADVAVITFQLIFHLGVSKNNGTPKSSILIGFSIINRPFWGVSPLFLETPISC